ncbi:MAG: hypothetical protein KGR26_00405 [Cyanobacteria bacterium REEB65]|nr:hypothetical protein [Cyanobacteria bacterium REEB65]
MTALKLGKLAAKFPGALRTLDFYVAGPLPAPPAAVATPAVADWGMLGNDRYGDCGVAGLDHGFMADAAIVSENESWPSEQDVIDFYLTYTDGQDAGVVLSEFLAYVRASGFCGKQKVSAFAPVESGNVALVQSAVDLFGFAYVGIQVPQSAEDQFGAGQPWTVVDDSPIIGGHCIPIVGYDDQYLYPVTWGRVQPMSYSFWHRFGDEAWAVLTSEFVQANGDGRGVNLAALQADLNQL